MNLETLYEKMEYGPAPESPNNAEQWLKDHQHKFSLFINGKWTESSKKNNFESINQFCEGDGHDIETFVTKLCPAPSYVHARLHGEH